MDPFVIVVSDEKISSKLGFDFLSNGSWKEDQIILQSCDIILGPPSTFSMWASYISQIPLIKLSSMEIKEFSIDSICMVVFPDFLAKAGISIPFDGSKPIYCFINFV